MSLIRIFALAMMAVVSFNLLAQVGHNTAVMNPNLASVEQLAGLAGSSAEVAEAITRGRPWLSMQDLDEALSGHMDDDERLALYEHVFLPLNLNTASASEIRLIPGMSSKMEHEFEEYRPYASLVEFRREIGKYVDEAEVTRLEQFVFVPMSLNSASGADFATIPGMTPKMVHEFEEYRPYRDMEQFGREIGKYVDEKEVARLGRYVVVDGD